MAEQFALQQSRGDGGTVHFYESPRPARAKIMDSTRNQLFSGTRFTINQHGGICRRHSLNLPQDTTEYGALADDLFKVSFGTDLVFEIKLFWIRQINTYGITVHHLPHTAANHAKQFSQLEV